jgi:uncharacterized protein involved in type VI secretion and phage assembly
MRSLDYGRPFDRRFYGVVEAVVVDIVDPEKEGRIKVRFPWYDEGTVTEWARVGQMYAGPGYGAFFVPEKDDEVLVAFVHGDMRMPMILGGLYNGKDKPPTHRQEDDAKNEKMIRTKAGHMLLFDDTKDKEKIQLLTSGGHLLSLDDAGHRITVRTSGGQAIVMDANDGSITLSGVTLTLNASSISIGDAPTDRVVLGDKLMALFNSHVHPVGTGTTGPPVTPMSTAQLSAVATVA